MGGLSVRFAPLRYATLTALVYPWYNPDGWLRLDLVGYLS
ncbi:hypothetical protein [Escherichia phage Mt1B1_P10]|uniref:Uncharacterized protein n=1 Tax=Escherichia phage Mt1B1_P10 TaxID=2743960 RepID=A0A7H0XCA5_9CAUD|nr:hypothetical protein [Escherichia phage Mt1B1_P10]